MTPALRPATADDLPAIADLHVRAWRWAYQGLMPQDYLDALSVDDRLASWQRTLARPDQRIAIAVAPDAPGGPILGFASWGASRDDDATAFTGQLQALYVEQAGLGTGVGRALMTAALDDLRARRFAEVTLWVLAGNQRARRFYERAGLTFEGSIVQTTRGAIVTEDARYRMSF